LSSTDDGHAVYDLYERLKGTGHFTVQDLQKRFRLAGEARKQSLASKDRLRDYRPDIDKISDPMTDAMLHIGQGKYTIGERRPIHADPPATSPLRGEGVMGRLRLAALDSGHPERQAARKARAAEIAAQRRQELEADLRDAERQHADFVANDTEGLRINFDDRRNRVRQDIAGVDAAAERQARREDDELSRQIPSSYRQSVARQEYNKERANMRRAGSTAV